MIHLREITNSSPCVARFPFSVPALANLRSLRFDAPVTFFMGGNGSGKSTLLESLAIASKRVVVGGTDLQRDASLDAIRPLAKALKLSWTKRTAKGFFLRAEDFFNFARRNRELGSELDGYADKYADDPRVRGYMLAQKAQLQNSYGDLNAASHGEGFLRVFQSRIVPGGLYLLDEPEAALSPHSQLALLYQMHAAVADGAQFIIATHSPIIASFPAAVIYNFAAAGIARTAYDELDSVALYRSFLRDPKNYLSRLLAD